MEGKTLDEFNVWKIVLMPSKSLEWAIKTPKLEGKGERESRYALIASSALFEITRVVAYAGLTYRISEKLGQISSNYF